MMLSDMVLVGQKDDETQACLSALFLTDPRDDREKLVHIKGPRVEGTCEWIKSNVLYDSWIHSHSQLLWLSGGPGKGKTMLSVFLAEELERTANDSENTLFL
jgi:Cdc6-like AAA superfamily ATPase